MDGLATALGGGLVMGLASALLLVANGKILGISGVLGGALKVRRQDARWRWAFILGMLLGGGLLAVLMPGQFENTVGRSTNAYLAAGTLVGIGTQLGSGCTSGHGICGIGRLSKRSVAATITFMISAGATVFVINHFFGGRV